MRKSIGSSNKCYKNVGLQRLNNKKHHFSENRDDKKRQEHREYRVSELNVYEDYKDVYTYKDTIFHALFSKMDLSTHDKLMINIISTT